VVGQGVEEEAGERDGPVAALCLRRAEDRRWNEPADELAIDTQRSPEEVDPVDHEAARLALAQPGADPNRYRYSHPRRETCMDPLDHVQRYRLRLRRFPLR
jgi:hypothetical protein